MKNKKNYEVDKNQYLAKKAENDIELSENIQISYELIRKLKQEKNI